MRQRRRVQEEGRQEEAEGGWRVGWVQTSDAGANERTPQQGEQIERRSRKGGDQGKEEGGQDGDGEGEGEGMSRDFAFEEYRWQPHGMQHRTVALVGDSLSRQQFLSLLCLLAPHPRVLPPNHTRPLNAVNGGGQGVAVVDVGWRFNLTWGAPVRGTARGAAVWLPGSNTTLLQRTSNLLCHEHMLPAAGRRQVGAGRRRQYRRVVRVYEADEWLLQHLWRLDVVVLSTANHWTASSFRANQQAVQNSPTARPFMPSESQLESTPFMAGLRRQALLAVMRSLALAAVRSARAAPPVIFLRSASPSHFTGGTFQSGGRCDMHA
ncbi:unnamed protein product, partial [Closterium sp. NIES-64]